MALKSSHTVTVNFRAGKSTIETTVKVDFEKARNAGRPVEKPYDADDARQELAESFMTASVKITGEKDLRAAYKAWLRENPLPPVVVAVVEEHDGSGTGDGRMFGGDGEGGESGD